MFFWVWGADTQERGYTRRGLGESTKEEKPDILLGSAQSPGNVAESEERLQWIVCYRAREETGRLDMEKMGEGSEDLDPAYVLVLCPALPAYLLL